MLHSLVTGRCKRYRKLSRWSASTTRVSRNSCRVKRLNCESCQRSWSRIQRLVNWCTRRAYGSVSLESLLNWKRKRWNRWVLRFAAHGHLIAPQSEFLWCSQWCRGQECGWMLFPTFCCEDYSLIHPFNFSSDCDGTIVFKTLLPFSACSLTDYLSVIFVTIYYSFCIWQDYNEFELVTISLYFRKCNSFQTKI